MTTRQKFAFEVFGAFIAVVLAMSCVRTSAQAVKTPEDNYSFSMYQSRATARFRTSIT